MITASGERNTIETVADLVANQSILTHRSLSAQKSIAALEADVEMLGQAEDARIEEIKLLRRDVERMRDILVTIITPRTLRKKAKSISPKPQSRRK